MPPNVIEPTQGTQQSIRGVSQNLNEEAQRQQAAQMQQQEISARQQEQQIGLTAARESQERGISATRQEHQDYQKFQQDTLLQGQDFASQQATAAQKHAEEMKKMDFEQENKVSQRAILLQQKLAEAAAAAMKSQEGTEGPIYEQMQKDMDELDHLNSAMSAATAVRGRAAAVVDKFRETLPQTATAMATKRALSRKEFGQSMVTGLGDFSQKITEPLPGVFGEFGGVSDTDDAATIVRKLGDPSTLKALINMTPQALVEGRFAESTTAGAALGQYGEGMLDPAATIVANKLSQEVVGKAVRDLYARGIKKGQNSEAAAGAISDLVSVLGQTSQAAATSPNVDLKAAFGPQAQRAFEAAKQYFDEGEISDLVYTLGFMGATTSNQARAQSGLADISSIQETGKPGDKARGERKLLQLAGKKLGGVAQAFTALGFGGHDENFELHGQLLNAVAAAATDPLPFNEAADKIRKIGEENRISPRLMKAFISELQGAREAINPVEYAKAGETIKDVEKKQSALKTRQLGTYEKAGNVARKAERQGLESRAKAFEDLYKSNP